MSYLNQRSSSAKSVAIMVKSRGELFAPSEWLEKQVIQHQAKHRQEKPSKQVQSLVAADNR